MIVGSLHDGACKSADECVCNPLYIAKPEYCEYHDLLMADGDCSCGPIRKLTDVLAWVERQSRGDVS